jgi:hypothetical protein
MSGFTKDSFVSILGGGIPGGMPLGGLIGGTGSGGRSGSSGMEGGGERELARLTLRRVVGNTTFPGGNPQIITPFRRFYNAGDTAGTINSNASPLLGQPNQLSGNSMVSRIHALQGGMNTIGQAFYSGNQKYVYDSSNYVRFKKLQAVNRNYNDSSFGGSGGSTVAQALWRVRR